MNNERPADQESRVAEFLSMGQQLLASPPLTIERVFEDMTTWYRDNRIDGAETDDDGDMLLLEWGESRMMQISEPTDIRTTDIHFAGDNVSHFSIARQVFVDPGEADDFDGAAIAMHIDLGFDPGTLAMFNHWIESPEGINAGREELTSRESLQTLWTTPAKHVAIFVGSVG